MLDLYPNVNSGVVSKLGFGIEAIQAAAVKSGRLINFRSFDPGKPVGMKRIKRVVMRGVPAVQGYSNGSATFKGMKVSAEATPESFDELLSTAFGAPTTGVVAVVATPAAPTVTPKGVVGVTNYSYKIVARSPQGDSPLSPAGTTATGNAALSAVNYNQVVWSAIAGATSYLVINSATNHVVGQTQGLSFNDTGIDFGAYAAPTGPTGNVQTWNANTGFLSGTLAAYYGTNNASYAAGNPMVHVWGGCRTNQTSLKFDGNTDTPLLFDFGIDALAWAVLQSLSAAGLDTATFDTLPPYDEVQAVLNIGGVLADAKTFTAAMDRQFNEKRAMRGFHGAVNHWLGEANHKITATLSFSTDAELQRWSGQVAQTGSFSEINNVEVFPAEIICAATQNTGLGIANGGGIINQFGLRAPSSTYMSLGQAIQGKEEITQEVEICPIYDVNAGTDLIVTNVNSRSNGSIITPGTAITGINYGSINPYSA